MDFVVSRLRYICHWFRDTPDLRPLCNATVFLIYLYLSAVFISVLFIILFYYLVLRSGARAFRISAGISIGLVLETLACLRYLSRLDESYVWILLMQLSVCGTWGMNVDASGCTWHMPGTFQTGG